MAKENVTQQHTSALREVPIADGKRKPSEAEKVYVSKMHAGYEIGECIDMEENIVNMHLFRINRKGVRTGFNSWVSIHTDNITPAKKN